LCFYEEVHLIVDGKVVSVIKSPKLCKYTYEEFSEDYEYILYQLKDNDNPSKELRQDKRDIEKEYPAYTSRYKAEEDDTR
ncbi:MAG: hypothetical protein WCJ57_04945, partial [Candidatus Falkowbacteria bacterium]